MRDLTVRSFRIEKREELLDRKTGPTCPGQAAIVKCIEIANAQQRMTQARVAQIFQRYVSVSVIEAIEPILDNTQNKGVATLRAAPLFR